MASTSQTWKDKILRKDFKHKAIFPKVFFFIKMDHYRLKSVTWSVCVWHRSFKSLIKYHPFLLRRAGGPGQKKKVLYVSLVLILSSVIKFTSLILSSFILPNYSYDFYFGVFRLFTSNWLLSFKEIVCNINLIDLFDFGLSLIKWIVVFMFEFKSYWCTWICRYV